MDISTEGTAKWPPLTIVRVLFGLGILAAMAAGYVGLNDLIHGLDPVGRETYGDGWNVFYYDLQLFVMGSTPLEQVPGPYSGPLNFARFAAPVATIYALCEAGGALFAGRFRRWWIRHNRGHQIVTGSTTMAAVLYASLRAEQQNTAWLGRRRVVHLNEPTLTPGSLLAAGVRGARVLYACGDDANDRMLNVATAQLAATQRRYRVLGAAITVYAHVSDPALALALRARWLAQPKPDKPQVDFFAIEELGARQCLEPNDFPVHEGQSTAILVLGWGPFSEALVVEFARRWEIASARRLGPITVRVVGANPRQLAELRECWDVVRKWCRLVECDDRSEGLAYEGMAPHRIFVCYEQEELALQTVLMGHELWQGGRGSVVVRLNRVARSTVLDTVGGRLRPFSVTEIACHPDVISEGLVERLAKAFHRYYLADQLAKGAELHSAPGLEEWGDLSPALREANRGPARHVGFKLARIGATAGPCGTPRADFAFTTAELEDLAEQEHIRWCAERTAAGWRRGPRDDRVKRHPDLVDWILLPESAREKDRESVRNLIPVLADAGLQVVRLGGGPTATLGLPRQVSVDA